MSFLPAAAVFLVLVAARWLWRAARPESPGRPVVNRADERLYEAVRRRDVTAAAEALVNGASAGYVQLDSWEYGSVFTPVLYVTCKQHDLEMVELLLGYGANPNAEYDKRVSGYFECEPCLHAVVAGPIPNYVERHGLVTPRPVEITRLLLENGADPNVPYTDRDDCCREMSLLGRARGNAELVELLQRYGAHE